MILSSVVEKLLPYLEFLAVVSLVTFLLSIILIPWYISRLPPDFFYILQSKRSDHSVKRAPFLILLLRNCIGVLLVIAGIIMLFMPGQGLLTILIGILCMSFPGKLHLLLYIIGMPSIQTSLNWTRKKLNRQPFIWSD